MTQLIIALIFGTLTFIVIIIGNAIARFREPAKNPNAFLKQKQAKNTGKVVVCAGDSHTHGVVAANYIDMLEKRFAPHYDFINAGINGNLAYNVLQRLDGIIACQPDIVTLLVGTNDVNATFNQKWEDQYRKDQKITEKPTLEWYRQNIEEIIDRLQSETDAKIAIIDLPMLGEDLDSETNEKINRYNATLKAIAEEKQVSYLALNERLRALLSQNHTPPPYEGDINLMGLAIMKHFILRKSWAAISKEHGLEILIDHIHLNATGASVITDLIADFLNQTQPLKS